jgi:hypothetical protein
VSHVKQVDMKLEVVVIPAVAVLRLPGHQGGTEPNCSYSRPLTRRSRALLISNAAQPPRENR